MTVAAMLAWATPGVGAAASPSSAAQPVAIRVRGQHPAVVLAAEELSRYLNQMAGSPGSAEIVSDLPPGGAAIEVGLAEYLGVAIKGLADPRRIPIRFSISNGLTARIAAISRRPSRYAPCVLNPCLVFDATPVRGMPQ